MDEPDTQTLYGELAEHATDIAFTVKSLYDAFILEGFSPDQAIELCKVVI